MLLEAWTVMKHCLIKVIKAGAFTNMVEFKNITVHITICIIKIGTLNSIIESTYLF